MSAGININVGMLNWAITRAGIRPEELAATFPKVTGWLNNTTQPTIKQLEEFANKVHVPFGYLFLPTPPQESLPIPFFRTAGRRSNVVSIDLFDTLMSVQRRQDWLVEYLKDQGAEPLPFAGKFRTNTSYRTIVRDMREILDLQPDWAAGFSTYEESLNHIAQKIEEIGVTVIFNGIVDNNTHRALKVEECRGFVIMNDLAPFLFINAADSKAAQLFTIIHELAHIWLGKSAGFDFEKLLPADDPVELLCDHVAAEFLVPHDLFEGEWNRSHNIDTIARRFKVSRLVIARRALDLQKISKSDFYQYYSSFTASEHQRKADSDGGNFYATQRKRVGRRFALYVDNAVKESKLSYVEAYRMTGLNGKTYSRFMSELHQ